MNQIKRKSDLFKSIHTSLRLEDCDDDESIFEIHNDKQLQFKDMIKDPIARRFKFDHIFDVKDKNCTVFETIVQPLLQQFLNGQNTTIYTYGQSKTKLTQTFYGSDMEDGVIQMSGQFLFNKIPKSSSFKMSIKLNEILGEEVNDLLQSKYTIREEPLIQSYSQFLKLCQLGSTKRKQEFHNGLSYPSGHSIFEITLNLNSNQQEQKLIFVELAGNEQYDNGKSEDLYKYNYQIASKRKGLITFYDMIEKIKLNQIQDQKKIIPFQNSVLTNQLKQAIRYNQQAFIFTITQTINNLKETLFSLHLNQNLKDIQIFSFQNNQEEIEVSDQKIKQIPQVEQKEIYQENVQKQDENQIDMKEFVSSQQIIFNEVQDLKKQLASQKIDHDQEVDALKAQISNLKKMNKLLYQEIYSTNRQKKKINIQQEQPIGMVQHLVDQTLKNHREFYISYSRKLQELELKINPQEIANNQQEKEVLNSNSSSQSDSEQSALEQSDSLSYYSESESESEQEQQLSLQKDQNLDKLNLGNLQHLNILFKIPPLEIYKYFRNNQKQIRKKNLIYMSNCFENGLVNKVIQIYNFQISGIIIYNKLNVTLIIILFDQNSILEEISYKQYQFQYLNTTLKIAQLKGLNQVMEQKFSIQNKYNSQIFKKSRALFEKYNIEGKIVELILKVDQNDIIEGLNFLMQLNINKKVIQYHIMLNMGNQIKFLIFFDKQRVFITNYYLSQFFNVQIQKIKQDLNINVLKLYYYTNYRQFDSYQQIGYKWKQVQLSNENLVNIAYENIYMD